MSDNLILDKNAEGVISAVIKLTLQHIAQFNATVRWRNLYLTKSTTFNKLLNYHANNCISHQRIYDAAAL